MAATSVTRSVAEQVRDAVQSVPGVAGLTSGRMGEAFLRVPGAMIEGIRVEGDKHLAVYVIYDLRSQRAIPQVVADIQAAVAAIPAYAETGAPRIDVVVADAVKA